MILLDTSGLLAAVARNQRAHERARAALEAAGPPLVLSPFVLAELDYLLAREAGASAALTLLAEVAAGAYDLAPFGRDDVHAATAVIERYGELEIGLADASLVVLAARHRIRHVLTLDGRHFRTLRGSAGECVVLVPADAQR